MEGKDLAQCVRYCNMKDRATTSCSRVMVCERTNLISLLLLRGIRGSHCSSYKSDADLMNDDEAMVIALLSFSPPLLLNLVLYTSSMPYAKFSLSLMCA